MAYSCTLVKHGVHASLCTPPHGSQLHALPQIWTVTPETLESVALITGGFCRQGKQDKKLLASGVAAKDLPPPSFGAGEYEVAHRLSTAFSAAFLAAFSAAFP